MIDAMGYEYLIRKAFGCGRQSKYGAEADIFRRYERELAKYKASVDEKTSSISNLSTEELAFNAGVECGRVSAHIGSAISKILNEYSEQLSEDQTEVLESCLINLFEPTKEKIEDTLEKAGRIFQDLGLNIG